MNLSVLLWGIPQAMRAAARVYPAYADRLKERNLIAQFRLRDRPEGRWIQLDGGKVRSGKGLHQRPDLTIHFKNREIARNEFVVAGKKVDIGAITSVAVKTVEGANDDISAPGQCIAALKLCTGLPDSKKASHLEPGAGHYGIFAGKSWRNNIRPLVLDFIDANSGAPKKGPKLQAV